MIMPGNSVHQRKKYIVVLIMGNCSVQSEALAAEDVRR